MNDGRTARGTSGVGAPLLTQRAAELRYGRDPQSFDQAVAAGDIAVRASGAACFWPEEVDLARARSSSGTDNPRAVLDAVRSSFDDLGAFRDIAERVARFSLLLTGAHRVIVTIYEETASDSPLLRVVVAVGGGETVPEMLRVPADGRAALESFLAQSEPLLLADVSQCPRWCPQPPICGHGMIAVPFSAGETARALLYAGGWSNPSEPTLDQAQMLAEICAIAAEAVRTTAPLPPSPAERIAQRRTDVSLSLVPVIAPKPWRADEQDGSLGALGDALVAVVPYDGLVIYRYDPTTDALSPVFSRGDAFPATRDHSITPGIDDAEEELRRCLRDRNEQIIEQKLNPVAGAEREPCRFVVRVPLIVNEAGWGVLEIGRSSARSFSPEELQLIRAFAAQAVAKINATNLLRQDELITSQRPERSVERLEAVLAITRAISDAATDVHRLLELVATELHRLAQGDEIIIYRVDESRTELHTVLHWHYEHEVPIPHGDHRLRLGEGIVGQIALSGQAENISCVDENPRARHDGQAASSAVARHVMVAPLRVADETVGVLCCGRFTGDPFDDEDFVVFRLVAEHVVVAIQQGRLVRERCRAEQQAATDEANLAAVYSVTRALTSVEGFDAVVMVLVRELLRLFPYHDLVIFRPDPDDGVLRSVKHFNIEDGRPQPQPAIELKLGEGLASACYLSAEPMLRNDAHLDPRSSYPFGREYYQRVGEHAMLIPLHAHDEAVGVLSVSRFGGEPFTENEFAVFSALGEQIALALRETILLQERQPALSRAARHSANLEAILATARAVSAQQDLASTLRILAEHLMGLVPHERLIVWQLDESEHELRAIFARVHGEDVNLSWTLPEGAGIIGRVIREGQPTLVNDAHRAAEAYHPPQYPRPIIPEHLLVAPLIVGQRAAGAVVLDRFGDWRFSEDDLGVFRVLAGQVEVAMQSALLIEEERRRRRHATALVDVASALNQAKTLSALVETLAKAAAHAVNVNRCSIYVYDAELRRSVAWYHYGVSGIPQHVLDEISAVGPQEFPVEREILKTGTTLRGPRLEELLAIQRANEVTRQRGGAVVPINLRGQIVGVFYVWDDAPDPTVPPRTFDTDEMELLEAIGALAGAAVDRARLYASMERRVAELRALGEINASITRSFDLPTITHTVLANIRAIVPFQLGTVVKWDEAAGALRVIDALGEDSDLYLGVEIPLDASINGTVFRTGRPLIHAKGDEITPFDISPSPRRLGPYTMSVPLRVDDRVIGTLHAIRDKLDPFTENDLAIFELVAGYLAVGIERAQTFEMALEARATSERYAQNVERVLEVSKLLALEPEFDRLLPLLTQGLFYLVPFTAGAVYSVESQESDLLRVFLDYRSGRVEPAPDIDRAGSLIGEALAQRETIIFSDVHDLRLLQRDLRLRDDAAVGPHDVHLLAIPLFVEGTAIGAITLVRDGGPAFTEDERIIVQVFAGQAASVLRNADLLARNRELYLSGVRALASAVDAKDTYTRGHSERVSRLVRAVADAMGLDRQEAETIELAGLLHDIGKIGIPDAILQKPGRLDDAERAVMMGHVELGAAILADTGTGLVQPLIPLVRHHHEWYNGRGYPDGLIADQIPLGSAIISVVDAFDTMVTDRPYRLGRSSEDALAELQRMAGVQFHPEVVAVFANLIHRQPELLQPYQTVQSPLTAVRAVGDHAASLTNGLMPARETARTARGGMAGQLGDLRALGLLMDLAGMTRDLTDLHAYLSRVANMVRRRLSYESVMLLLVDRERGELYNAAFSADDTSIALGYRQPIDRGVCGWVIREKRTRNVPDVLADPDSYLPWPNPGGSELVVPLIVDDDVIGLINVESSRIAAFTAADEAVLTAVAEYVATAVHVAQLHAAAKHAAITDGLTGVLNHRAFYEGLEQALEQHATLSVVIFDVEGLKQVNDSVGHLAGDAVLREVAQTIREHVRPLDLVARYGGDEFAVVLPDIGGDEATLIAATIRETLRRRAQRMVGPLETTVRYGVAEAGVDGQGAYELIAAADVRLYAMRSQQSA